MGQQLSFSFPQLQYSLFKFSSRKICQHLMNWTSWNKHGKVRSSVNSLFKWHFHSLRCYLSSLFLTRKRMNLLSLEYAAVPSEKLPFNPHVPFCSLIELFTLYILRGTLSSGWIWLNCMTWLHYLVLHAFLCRCVIFLSVMRTKGVVFFFS